jgi:glycosyltransferase involved in cell wall biosynthesis
MTNPIISIIIPCYNAEKWIEQCVNSALNQTYENLEVIVVDNESEDNSLKVINKLKELNPLLITSTAPNLYKYSWTEPVEEALSLASGEYFTIVGSDDYLDEKYIENIVDVIKRSNGKIEIFQSPICGIDINNLPINNGSISHSYKNLTEFKQKLFTGCPVNTPTVVYKKSIHEEGNIFWDSESFLGSADYNLYFHLADKKKFIYPIPKWLGYYYRWHSDQATWGMQKEETRYDEKIKDYWRKKWKI